MNNMGMIVAVISVLASLFLVTRGSTFQSIRASQGAKLAGIWVIIIVVLVVVITLLQR